MLNNNKEIGNDKKGVKHKDTQRHTKGCERGTQLQRDANDKKEQNKHKGIQIRIERCDTTTKTGTTKRYKATNSK